MPFATQLSRDTHFERHGRALGAVDAAEYESMADAFMSNQMDRNTRECPGLVLKERVRFNTSNRRFGVEAIGPPPYLKTFYIVNQATINYHGDEMRFFGYECGRIKV